MNTTKRLLLGVVSTLLLAVGFARAADRFDPMSAGLRVESTLSDASMSAPTCNEPCSVD